MEPNNIPTNASIGRRLADDVSVQSDSSGSVWELKSAPTTISVPSAKVPKFQPYHCVPGLETLLNLDQVYINQQLEFFEIVSGLETSNRYVISDPEGRQLFYVREESDPFERNCCGAQRAFILHFLDPAGIERIRIYRAFNWAACCPYFACSGRCQDELEVQAPPDRTIGFVKQRHMGCQIQYDILDGKGDSILRIYGPNQCWCYICKADIAFDIMSIRPESVTIGKIAKEWTNLMQEWLTDADKFGIQFPRDLHSEVKAIIMGAVFLIDFMYFERTGGST